MLCFMPGALDMAADVEATIPDPGPSGLSAAEARQRLERCGPNTIARQRKASLLVAFAANFTHLMAVLLWVSGVLAFLAGMPELGVAVFLVNIINGGFSFFQEYKAEKATEALLRLLPQKAHVVRDGIEVIVPAEELVPGDLMILNDGDHISADARVTGSFSLSVDESTLTGESRPIRKSPSENRPEYGPEESHRESNLVFAGTNVVSGRGQAVVFATGASTRFGKIAELTQSIVDEPSPLQEEMKRVTRTVSILAVGIGAFFFVLSSVLGGGHHLEASFIFAMGMVVAFVPEGMLPTVTLSLALCVQTMAARNALVKKLSAVETLGCTTVICSDKTGTITQNKMTVLKVWTADAEYSISGTDYSPEGSIDADRQDPDRTSLTRALVAACHCNNARLLPPHKETDRDWSIEGDPTEGALIVLARKAGISVDSPDVLGHRICELAFDSHRQRMSTVYDIRGKRVLYLKGAPTRVLDRSTKICLNGESVPLNAGWREKILEANDRLAGQGLRVLALAERQVPGDLEHLSPGTLEHDLTFCGLAAMLDPPHEGVLEAVRQCHSAGIKVVMITGDYGLTAESIARRVEILPESGKVVTGAELDAMDDRELAEVLAEPVVFARVLPEQKLRIVSVLQTLDHIVAVTGDGVNDAPALRKSDIGIAMGIAGTDVAKEAADIILLDDNFASIVTAVELGRSVYANIRRFATYVFTSNMAEAVPFVVSFLSRGAIPLPLTVMQVLAVDLGTDMLPALALGAEPAEPDVMSNPPRDKSRPLLDRMLLCKALLWYGAIEGLAGMLCFFHFTGFAAPAAASYQTATTMTFLGIVMGQIGAVLCCRTVRSSIFSRRFFANPLVFAAIGAEILVLLAVMYLPPLARVFGTTPIAPEMWLFALIFVPAMIVLDELRKLIARSMR